MNHNSDWTNLSISERQYHSTHNLQECPGCLVCNDYTDFISHVKGYMPYCSETCANVDGKSIVWLSEQSLGEALRACFPSLNIVHNKTLRPFNIRPDYVIDELKLVVEYDGPLHFTSAKVAIDDFRKERVLAEAGYVVVRWTYFVQVDSLTLEHFLGNYSPKLLTPLSSFPQGFISKKAPLPADFCSAGIARYEKIISACPPGVRSDIRATLSRWALDTNIDYVVYPAHIAIN